MQIELLPVEGIQAYIAYHKLLFNLNAYQTFGALRPILSCHIATQ